MLVTNRVLLKRETLNLRIKPAKRDLIDRTADTKGKKELILFWKPPVQP